MSRRLTVSRVPVEQDAEGLVGVVVEEVEGFGGSGGGQVVGGHAVGVEGAGSGEGQCLSRRPKMNRRACNVLIL